MSRNKRVTKRSSRWGDHEAERGAVLRRDLRGLGGRVHPALIRDGLLAAGLRELPQLQWARRAGRPGRRGGCHKSRSFQGESQVEMLRGNVLWKCGNVCCVVF